MSNTDTEAQRLENLEFKLMELENTVAELNQVIITQYHEIDQLKSHQLRLANLVDTLQKAPPSGESGDSGASTAEIPPHY